MAVSLDNRAPPVDSSSWVLSPNDIRLSEREEVLVFISAEEKREWLVLFTVFQKIKFPGYYVRMFKCLRGESLPQCVQRCEIPEGRLTHRSILIICNGEKTTQHNITLSILHIMWPNPAVSEKTSKYYKKKRLTLRHATTLTGTSCIKYFDWAMRSDGWETFYGKTVSATKIHFVYQYYCDKTEGKKGPADSRSVMRNLYALMPVIRPGKRVLSTQHCRFPLKETCLQRWTLTQAAIGKNPHRRFL